MVAKKKTKTLKLKQFTRGIPHSTPFTEQMTVQSTVGVGGGLGVVGTGWGREYTGNYKLGSLIDLLMSDGLDAHTIGDIVQIYLDAKHNL